MSGRTRAYGRSLAALSTRLAGETPRIKRAPMTNRDKDKAERLAAALRDNLRRRKAQARDAAKPPSDPAKD